MAVSTQIVLLCLCCFVADSYLFEIDFTDGEDHFRIPLDLPNPFNIFHGMFDPPKSHGRDAQHHHRRPFTSEITTAKQEFKEEIVTTISPLSNTENSQEDIFVKMPDNIDRQEPAREKYDDEVKPQSEDHSETPQVNNLSIHDEPILSIMIPNDSEKITTELPKLEAVESIEGDSVNTKAQNNKTDPSLNKNSDYLITPVNAVLPTILNTNPKVNESSNTLTPMSGMDNGINYNQGYPNNGFNPNINNMNPNPVSLNPIPNYNNINPNLNAVPYGYQSIPYGNGVNPSISLPNQVNPGNLPNSYTMMPVSNMQGANLQTLPNNNNLYYMNPNVIQPNSPQQLYNLVPINNNYPNNFGVNQPNNYIPNNQPNNFVPYSNKPINYFPVNQPNNFVPANNNLVPANNNFVPANNNFVPANTNFIPANNNFVPANNNFIPVNNNNPNNVPINQPYSFIPINNQPITADPNNYNGPLNNNFNNQPNNFLPINNIPNNFSPNQGNNFIPYKDHTNANDVVSQPQPVISLIALNDKEDTEKVTPQNEQSINKENNEESSDKENNDQKD